ncbi:hypothetical protein IEQ34_023096 [Dendrobium chrysotoxum]|uniref:Uncharacterized protein n=1 Tax=Dendrobium chrysotoxum TaxID=161865 RepID=A0AAV7FYY6_DENCH|nr:hypothetical protein IEQ34_023096 [Dendrobium chrysotoxum]
MVEGYGEDLFWAIRGPGSAGFGVIVSFKVNLVVVPPILTTFNVRKTLRQNATKVVAWWQELVHKFDVNLFISVIAQASTDTDGSKIIQVRIESVLFFYGNTGKPLEILMDRSQGLNISFWQH